jgi:hypothetical protein
VSFRRGALGAAIAVVVAGAVLVAVAGCGGRAAGARAAGADSAPEPVATASPLAAPVAVQKLAPGPTATPSPSHGSGSPKPATKGQPIKPSRDPLQASQPLPPPPHPPAPPPGTPAPGGSCPSYTGPKAPTSDVRAALDAAAARQFLPVSAPTVRVPANLLYAVAWQESGWQSTILACDGGIGTMQIMPATAKWMNDSFGTSYDVQTLNGNVMIGGEYLALMIKIFGNEYFQGSYDLSAPAAPGSVSLLDSVISAYNFGPGAVDPTKGTAGIPNWRYVSNVEALMTSCPCLK